MKTTIWHMNIYKPLPSLPLTKPKLSQLTKSAKTSKKRNQLEEKLMHSQWTHDLRRVSTPFSPLDNMDWNAKVTGPFVICTPPKKTSLRAEYQTLQRHHMKIVVDPHGVELKSTIREPLSQHCLQKESRRSCRVPFRKPWLLHYSFVSIKAVHSWAKLGFISCWTFNVMTVVALPHWFK